MPGVLDTTGATREAVLGTAPPLQGTGNPERVDGTSQLEKS